MMYALIVDDAVAESRDFTTAPDPNPAKGLDWRPLTLVKPDFNLLTESLDGPTDDIQPEGVTRTWTVRAKTVEEIAVRLDAIVAQFDNKEAIIRAVVLIFMDEFNRRQTQMDALLVGMNNQIQDATTLANLKTRWASFTAAAQTQALPQRTVADLRAAIRAKLGNGTP